MGKTPIGGSTARVAANVRAIRGLRKVSGRELAQAIHVSQSQMYRMLDGEVAWTLDAIEAAAAFLNVPVQKLMGEEVAA